MWPASKVVPKELFPLGKVPAIVHLFWELMDAGVSRIIVVASRENSGLMRELLDPKFPAPKKMAGDPLVQRFQKMLAEVEFILTEQAGNYGNGTPLSQSAELLRGEPCIYCFGDDIFFGENVSRELIRIYERTGFPVMSAQEVEPSRKSSFGIFEVKKEGDIQYLTRILEKPAPGETESNLAGPGRYLVTPELLGLLTDVTPGKDNEIWFTDSVLRRLQSGGKVCVYTLRSGKWYTVGDPAGYTAAVQAATTQL